MMSQRSEPNRKVFLSLEKGVKNYLFKKAECKVPFLL